jgi:hypothetical protein
VLKNKSREMRLLNVARASFEELLLDFEDFLRHRRLSQWTPDSKEAKSGKKTGNQFRGCSDYPNCKGVVNFS